MRSLYFPMIPQCFSYTLPMPLLCFPYAFSTASFALPMLSLRFSCTVCFCYVFRICFCCACPMHSLYTSHTFGVLPYAFAMLPHNFPYAFPMLPLPFARDQRQSLQLWHHFPMPPLLWKRKGGGGHAPRRPHKPTHPTPHPPKSGMIPETHPPHPLTHGN